MSTDPDHRWGTRPLPEVFADADVPRVVLVTGVARHLGARVAARLADDPRIARIIGIDALDPSPEAAAVLPDRVEFVRADVRTAEPAKVMISCGVEAVVHLSIVSVADAHAHGRAGMKEQNVIGTMQLLAACQQVPDLRRVIVRSSTAAYGASFRDPAVFTESTEPLETPRGGFARDVLDIEGYVRGFQRRRPDAPTTVLRFAPFIGEQADTSLTRYFAQPVVPTVFGRDPRLQFVHMDDAMEILYRSVVEHHPGTFNVAGAGTITLSQAVRRAGRIAMPVLEPGMSALAGFAKGVSPIGFSLDQLDLFVHGRVVDTSRLVAEYGFEPRTTPVAFADFLRGHSTGAVMPREVIQVAERTILEQVRQVRAGIQAAVVDADAPLDPDTPVDIDRLLDGESSSGADYLPDGEPSSGADYLPDGEPSSGADHLLNGEPSSGADHLLDGEPSRDAGLVLGARARRGANGGIGTAGESTGAVDAAAIGDERDIWDERVAAGLAFLRRRLTGDYDVDEFGFDQELTDGVFQPMLRPLYRDWFRVEVFGAKHVPVDGAGLIVANHSGTVALDALMLTVAVRDERRYLRLLGADLVFRVPFVSELARKSGATLACQPDVERLLGMDQLVGVFPEGFKGVGKHYRDRYKLQRFGRGGFVAAALRTGTPIVPVAIIGAEEIYPLLGNVKPLARLLGLPYFPVTPTFPWLGPLGLVPLPSKWLIEFCQPIETAHLADQADDPMVVFNLADQVRETIQQTVHELLARRPDAF